MKNKKVAIIGTVGLPANYGGFETLTAHLVEHLSSSYEMTVYCSGKKYPKADRVSGYKGARLKYLPLDANGIQSILYDSLSILHALFYADVLLILGVAGAWLLPFVKLFTRKKIIISIDGIEWKRDKWNRLAQWYLFWAEGMAVKYSHIDISDNEAIQDYTASRYGSLSRIIEYGADHTLSVSKDTAGLKKYPFLNFPYAIKVCRIEPENNVHIVLEAFARLPQYRLVMVGNWANSLYGKELKAKYQKCANIHLSDPIYNQKALDLLRSNATVYLHGHAAGGTNPSLVEAMYLGLPVIAFGVSYNKVTTERKAMYFSDLDSLINTLEQTDFAALKKNGTVMKEIAIRRYTWALIAEKYDQLIAEALESKSKISARAQAAEITYTTLLDMEISHLKNAEPF